MRKEYVVRIVVDDRETKLPSETQGPFAGDPRNDFDIVVRNSGGGSPADNLAHELGHVVARIFETPKAMADPRMQAVNAMFRNLVEDASTREKAQVVAAEREAWDFAEKVRPVDQDLRRRMLETYEKW